MMRRREYNFERTNDMNEIDYSIIYHQASKDHSRGHLPISKDADEWPEAWKVHYYKTYPRLFKIKLPKEKPRADLFELILQRHSSREYTKQPVSLSELATLLQYSCGITSTTDDGASKRAQPSGGGRFPIEIYPLVLVPGKDLPVGLYHYDVKHHQLDVLWQHVFDRDAISEFFSYEWVTDVSIVFIMTAVFERNQMKYGERGYRYILLEAGHIGQNIHLISEALQLKCCALGGTKDEHIDDLLDIDGMNESLVYAVAVGK